VSRRPVDSAPPARHDSGEPPHPSLPPPEVDQEGVGRGEEALRRFHEEEDLAQVYDVRMLRGLWPHLRPHRHFLYGSAALLVVMAAFGLVRPLVMRAALERFQEPDGAALLTQFGLLLGALIVIEQALSFPQLYWLQIAGTRAMADLRRRVFTFLHTRSMAFFDRTPLGRLVTRVTNDVDAIAEMFAMGALNAIGDLIRLVAIVVIMLSLDWKMSLFAFVAVPPVALAVNWTRKRMRVAYREVRSKTARMNAFLNEQVSGIDVVQAYAREQQSEQDFDDINYAYRAVNTRAVVLDASLDAAIEMVGSVCIAAVLWYAGARAVSPDITFGTLFAFIAYLEMFFMPVRHLSARYTAIQSALAGAERVFQLLSSTDQDAEVRKDIAGDQERSLDDWPPSDGSAFAFQGVTFGYKPGVPVVHDIHLEARRGETMALVGPTGSGKSTLASLLLRLYNVAEGDGEVQVLGRDVSQIPRNDLRSQFAVVPQDVFLFPGTVASNIAARDAEPDLDRVRATLERIGALDLFEDRDQGLDAPVLERGSNYSAGERQLIAFARALYRNPPLLVLDEPTANIDSDTESRLQQAMDVALEGRTALVIAHRLSTVRNADRVVVMHQGRIVEQGSHDELLELDGVYARLHRLQVAQQAIEERMDELVEPISA
jgi:ATP-binding cassette subfamily B multidrug efflux pump